MNDGEKFHWQEGAKYAGEAVKAVFLLNGAAAISVLTFIGNHQDRLNRSLETSIELFAFGALTAPATLLLAYLTTLLYGYEEATGKGRLWGVLCHALAFVPFLAGAALFITGMRMAASGLAGAP